MNWGVFFLLYSLKMPKDGTVFKKGIPKLLPQNTIFKSGLNRRQSLGLGLSFKQTDHEGI